MTGLDAGSAVAVVGTGTMGQGIAQVALLGGHQVLLHDSAEGRARAAAEGIAARLARLVEKERLTAAERDAALAGLRTAERPADLAAAALVVEAVVERLDVKRALLSGLEEIVDDDCLLATNTSSLSVTAIGGALREPGRLVGLHFFNPVPLLPLVEVVSGVATDEAAATRAYATARAWGKTPVRCADTPGFIVNRVARPFYAEALRLYEENVADPATIDAVLRESGGFRMGPFELMDLIGQDVNEAVTRSVWEAFHHDPRFAPSSAQRRLVEAGLLGRKSGRGWYAYGDGAERPAPRTEPPTAPPARVGVHGRPTGPLRVLVEMLAEAGIETERDRTPNYADSFVALPHGAKLSVTQGDTATGEVTGPAVLVDLALDYRACTRVALAAGDDADPADLAAAVGLFQRLGKDVSVVDDAPGMIVARTVAMLADFALDAEGRGIATGEDIDTAMRLGVNYPRGPLAWGAELGARWVGQTLSCLNDAYPGGRYGASPWLSRRGHLDYKRELGR
ncbi:3-hydroxyacyl-CoA dehydrogenase [Streptomyces sp. NPDC050560]|uniref:3-hydroxyacyl-CoA dehydrogenase n=1 Tax=Streptomyces sp. NPDC050560 TaxID=3365630 RepID=UPI0037958980